MEENEWSVTVRALRRGSQAGDAIGSPRGHEVRPLPVNSQASMAKSEIEVLIIDDDRNAYAICAQILRRPYGDTTFRTYWAPGFEEGIQALKQRPFDICLLDYRLGANSGLRLLQLANAQGCKVPFIMLTGQGDEYVAVQAMKLGAADYVSKRDLRTLSLPQVIANTLQQGAQKRRIEENTQRMLKLAMVDEVSGAYRRRYAIDRSQQEFARYKRYGDVFCFGILDLDDFKRINDTYGHTTGDSLLSLVGKILKTNLRATDILGRYGGDEFCVVFPNTDEKNARKILKRVVFEISQTRFVARDGRSFQMTCSAGVCEVSPTLTTLESLIHEADLALYEAKKSGKNRVAVASDLRKPAGG